MEINKINEDVLCILIHNQETSKIETGYVPIEKDLEVEFKGLMNMFESENWQAKAIVNYIINHRKLNTLFSNYNYCSSLSSAFQGLYSTIEVIQRKYPSNFSLVQDAQKRKELIAAEKDRLLLECKDRLLANYLEKAYSKYQKDKGIIAFSHRRVGWSAPKYSLNENFSVELKTNFGYGSVSYFYSKIRYKELDIVPFSDWVNYKVAYIFEIVRYSAKHFLQNESWLEAMEFIGEACNLSLADEEKFVQKYVIDQCDEMISGLEKILTDESFKLKGYTFLNQERGFVDLKLKGHNLVEYRGEKISGALQFVSPIKQFSHIIEINGFLSRIETCNLTVKPMLIEEQRIIKIELTELNTEKNKIEIILNRLNQKNTIYDQKRRTLLQKLATTLNTATINTAEFEKKFLEQNPEYDNFKKELAEITTKFNTVVAEINRVEKIYNNLVKYQKEIEDYFNK
jgi:hypothetical protein